METLIIGAVGVLQFEVLEHRLRHEYNVDIRLTHLAFKFARWLTSEVDDIKKLNLTSSTIVVEDIEERPVFLFENEWSIQWALERNKGLTLDDIASFGR